MAKYGYYHKFDCFVVSISDNKSFNYEMYVILHDTKNQGNTV